MDTADILKLIEVKIATNPLWAEAFAQLDEMDDIGQNAIVWWMGNDITKSKQWDENLISIADKLELMGKEALQRTKERQEQKSQRRRERAAAVNEL